MLTVIVWYVAPISLIEDNKIQLKSRSESKCRILFENFAPKWVNVYYHFDSWSLDQYNGLIEWYWRCERRGAGWLPWGRPGAVLPGTTVRCWLPYPLRGMLLLSLAMWMRCGSWLMSYFSRRPGSTDTHKTTSTERLGLKGGRFKS